jgi:very-short-patch-repair endonuclease
MIPKGLTLRRAQTLRRAMTPPEIKLWQALRYRQTGGWRFRRQHPLGPWIVDFYCLEQKLAVEVDGWSHNMGELGRDERRDADLARRGVWVIRFAAADVMENVDGVVETIIAELGGRRAPAS